MAIKYLGYQNGKVMFFSEEPLDPVKYTLEKVEETDREYVLSEDNSEFILKEDTVDEAGE